jgi:hypothetical protein
MFMIRMETNIKVIILRSMIFTYILINTFLADRVIVTVPLGSL